MNLIFVLLYLDMFSIVNLCYFTNIQNKDLLKNVMEMSWYSLMSLIGFFSLKYFTPQTISAQPLYTIFYSTLIAGIFVTCISYLICLLCTTAFETYLLKLTIASINTLLSVKDVLTSLSKTCLK